MLSRLLHDSCYCGGFALNTLLIILIVTRTPPYLRQMLLVRPTLPICNRNFNSDRVCAYSQKVSNHSFHQFFDSYYLLEMIWIAIQLFLKLIENYWKIHDFRTMSTSDHVIYVISGVCRRWESPQLCFYLNAVQLAGISHYAVMIAFCSCYRYYVIACSRTEPTIRHVLLALICVHSPTISIYASVYFARSRLLEGTELDGVMNDSYPDYDMSKMKEIELLLVTRRSLATGLAEHWIQGVIVPVCFIVLVASVRINGILASLDHMSANNKRRHAQILRGLLCQATLPVLYAIAVVVHRTENRQPDSGADSRNLTMMIASFSAVMSPLLTLTFTLPYRDVLLERSVSALGIKGRNLQFLPKINSSLRVLYRICTVRRTTQFLFHSFTQSFTEMFTRHYHNQIVNDVSCAWQELITVLSLTVNAMLLRIVFTCQRNDMGPYRYLIASFAVSDLIYTVVHWIVYPVPETYQNAFLLSAHGISTSRLAACIYCGVYSQATPILVCHFVYRTLYMRSPAYLPRTAYFFTTLISSTVAMNINGQEVFVMYYLFRPDGETLSVIAPFFAGNTSAAMIHHIDTAEKHIQALYWANGTFSQPRWLNLLGAFDAFFVISITYTIIIICAFLIGQSLKGHAHSWKTLSLQHQLYRSLLCQAVYPFISTYTPLGISMFLPIIGLSFDWVSTLCPPLCVSHPLFDAIVLIFCITSYRRMFLRSIGLSRCIARERRGTLPSLEIAHSFHQSHPDKTPIMLC